MKNGVIFNPDYQHTKIAMWAKIDIIDKYHDIKSEVRNAVIEGRWHIDKSHYKIHSKNTRKEV